MIVVGDSGVGKSSILFRFVNDEFNEFSEATLGAAFVSKVHTYGADKTIRFQVWDTAGQEKYKSIAPIYYRGIAFLSQSRRSPFASMISPASPPSPSSRIGSRSSRPRALRTCVS